MNLEQRIQQLEREVKRLTNDLKIATALQKDFGGRQIIRRDVQFMGKVYKKTGAIVTQINP